MTVTGLRRQPSTGWKFSLSTVGAIVVRLGDRRVALDGALLRSAMLLLRRWPEHPDQPAIFGSPFAIGDFRDSDRLERVSDSRSLQGQRVDLPKLRDDILGALSLSRHCDILGDSQI